MSSFCRRSALSAFSFAVVLVFCGAPNAFAQKLTYEQAFAKCKDDVTKNVNAGESAGTAARYARAGACMLQYGFRLKRADRAGLASAQKLTYEQAFAKCKEDVTKHVNAGEGMGTAARYARGGACMHKYGFRLKRSDREELEDL